MPSVCPRPCSRLATAAVFLSVGVVQFTVGVILLRSEFVYQLAGPVFCTSSCNIAVGCLLGISAYVWRISRKRESRKQTTRRRVLLSLVSSALLMNATTLVILLLGEGNALLSIDLESDGKTSASELLAYAYVTSVCCPVVCIVVSIVSMSGNCFNNSRKDSIQRRFSLGSFKKRKSESLQWVYSTENRSLPKSKPRDFVSSSSSEESENDSVDTAVRQKHSSSIEELQSVLSRMAHGNRDSIIRDSALMLRQLDLRRQNRINSLNQDGSYIGPSLIRMKEFSASEKSPRTASNELNDSGNSKIFNPERYSSELNDNSRLASGGSKLVSYSKRDKADMEYRNPYSRKYTECTGSSQPREVIYSSHQRNYGENLLARPQITESESCLPSYIPDYNVNRDIIFSHKAFKPTPEIEYLQKSIPEEHPVSERNEESLDDEISANQIKRRHCVNDRTKGGLQYETTKNKERPHYKTSKTREESRFETSNIEDGSRYETSKAKEISYHDANKTKERSHYETSEPTEGLRYETCKIKERSHYGTSEPTEGSRYETRKIKERSHYETSEPTEGSRYETRKIKERSHYETSEPKEGSLYETREIKERSHYEISKSPEEPRYRISKPKEINNSPDINNCFSPEGSEFSEDSILDSSRTSPWAGEMISISFKNPPVARLSDKLIPVASPVIPSIHQDLDLPKMSDDSGIFSIQSTSFSSDAANQNDSNGKDRKVSSFRENTRGCKELVQEFPKAGSQGIKKYDLSRVVTMASISEEPNLDANGLEPKPQCAGEETPKLSLESRRVSLPSVFSDSEETRRQQLEDSDGNYSPRRKRSLSTKALRKLLSLSSIQTDFLDQVVDNDSLIGLSEEELIARQLRTRSIRKTVQQRIKDEMAV